MKLAMDSGTGICMVAAVKRARHTRRTSLAQAIQDINDVLCLETHRHGSIQGIGRELILVDVLRSMPRSGQQKHPRATTLLAWSWARQSRPESPWPVGQAARTPPASRCPCRDTAKAAALHGRA